MLTFCPGDVAVSLGVPLQKELSNTSSPETFDFIKRCLRKCHAAHSCSDVTVRDGKKTDSGHPLNPVAGPFRTLPEQSSDSRRLVPNRERLASKPTRLLDLTTFGGGPNEVCDIRLWNVTGSCPDYLTLSHCWGNGELGIPENIKTKTDTLQEQETRISVITLPQTFRDAIEITLRLGFRYLWIDALCIIQNSPEDWAAESRKMGYIYSHAVLNIAASGSSDSHGGCFNSASCSQNLITTGLRSNKIMQLPSTLKDGSKSVLLLWLNGYDRRERLFANNYRGDNSNVPDLLHHSAVLKRGWIFQERMLSKRIVHFTKQQVLWECRESWEAEDGLHVDTDWGVTKCLHVSRDDFLNYWYIRIIAGDYSRQRFTYSKDRLIAIAGLAELFQQEFGLEYLAGIWALPGYGDAESKNQEYLRQALSWYSSDPDKVDVASQRELTWSWISHNGPVDWHLNHPNSSQREPVSPEWLLIVKQCCLLHEGKPTHALGPVDYGYLVVEGFLTQGKMSWITDALTGAKGSPKSGQCGEGAYHPDDNRCFPTGDVFFLILDETEKDLIHTLMILEPIQSTNDSYKRTAIVFMALVDLKWLESGKRITFKLF